VNDARGTAPNRMLPGDSVYRIVWLPGTDTLIGYHPSGASHEAQDPIELWEWLLNYPGDGDDEPGPGEGSGPSPDRRLEYA